MSNEESLQRSFQATCWAGTYADLARLLNYVGSRVTDAYSNELEAAYNANDEARFSEIDRGTDVSIRVQTREGRSFTTTIAQLPERLAGRSLGELRVATGFGNHSIHIAFEESPFFPGVWVTVESTSEDWLLATERGLRDHLRKQRRWWAPLKSVKPVFAVGLVAISLSIDALAFDVMALRWPSLALLVSTLVLLAIWVTRWVPKIDLVADDRDPVGGARIKSAAAAVAGACAVVPAVAWVVQR
jgi:hypothetical protein